MADPKPPRLRRCPFCGGKARMAVSLDEETHWVVCPPCGASSPCSYEQADAARAWNKRVKK